MKAWSGELSGNNGTGLPDPDPPHTLPTPLPPRQHAEQGGGAAECADTEEISIHQVTQNLYNEMYLEI